MPSPTSKRPGQTRPRKGTRPLRHGTVSAQPDAPIARSPLTTRAALLGLALSAVAVLLALPARTYFSQKNQIDSARAAQTKEQHTIQLLQQQVTRLQDPAQVEDQARQRLGYVKPGERQYVILGTPAKPSAAPKTSGPAAPVLPPAAKATNIPWWSKLWGPVSK